MKVVYLLLSLLGLLIPYGALVPWVVANGLNIPLIAEQAMANSISLFAWLDVVIAAVVLLLFIACDARANQVKGAIYPVIGTLIVGVSFGLPLYLYLRERHLNNPVICQVGQ